MSDEIERIETETKELRREFEQWRMNTVPIEVADQLGATVSRLEKKVASLERKVEKLNNRSIRLPSIL